MEVKRIEGCTRVVGKAQGYLGLPLRDEFVDCTVNGPNTPSMIMAFEPSARELEALNKGADIHLRILGSSLPPVILTVGPIPEIK